MNIDTIVGVFDDAAEARDATDRLVMAGVPRDDIETHGDADDASRHGGAIRSFFRELFGIGAGKDDADDDYSGAYAEAVRRGCTVLIVKSADDAVTARIVATLEASGAIDIDERVGQWRAAGYTGFDEDAAPYTPEQIAAERRRPAVLDYDVSQAIPADPGDRSGGREDRGRVRIQRRVDETSSGELQPGQRARSGVETVRGVIRRTGAAVENAMAGAGDVERPSTGATVGGGSASGAAWSAGQGQHRYEGPERRVKVDRSYSGTERRVAME